MGYESLCVLLLLLGLALLVAEVFVPSGGFLAVLVLFSIAGSAFCAYAAWWESGRGLWWAYVATVTLLVPATLIGAFVVFPRTQAGRNMLLEAPAPDEIATFVKEQAELHRLVGRRGKTVTPHNPGGMTAVDGRRHHSETRGMLLDADQPVEILAVRGNRLLIRLADAAPPPTDPRTEIPPAAAEPVVEPPRPPDDPFDPFDPFADEARQA